MGNIKAENGIIGLILLNNESLEVIHDSLKSYMFSSEIHKACYKAMVENWERNVPTDVTILSNQLAQFEMPQDEISEFLIGCINDTPSEDRYAIKSYSDIVVNEYKSNQLRKITSNITLLPNSIDADIQKMSMAIDELNSQTLKRKAKSLADIFSEVKEEYFNPHEIRGIRTGFYRLDQIVVSLEPETVTIIGARPSVGKSALATQIILQVANMGKKVGYYNLEMSDKQVMDRMIAFCSRIDMNRIKTAQGFNDIHEQGNFERGIEALSRFQVFVRTGTTSVSTIRSECKHEDYDCLVIDYMQLIKPDKNYQNRASEVGDISKALKELSHELKIPIIVLSQLNRASEGKDTKEPTMAELRESGDIEQDADNIFMIWNLSTVDDKFKGLKVEKNRQGERGKYIGMEFKGNIQCFIESNEEWGKFQNRVKDMEKSITDLRNYTTVEETDAEELFT